MVHAYKEHRDYAPVMSLADREIHERRLDPNAPGMDDIRFVMSQNVDWLRPSDILVGSFGIKDESGRENLLHWRISGDRKDLRHGAVDPEEPSRYGKSLLKSMFAGW